jgi:two-component system phosphate regulon sensor histidine kinase PhoR
VARPIGESVARRRVFWLLVALVVVPTLLLAAYGLAGLKNQNDAAWARLRERYVLQSRALEQDILLRLQEEDERVREAARSGGATAETVLARASLADAVWFLPDDDVPPAVREAAKRVDATTSLTFTSVDEGHGTSIVAFSTVGAGRVVAWRLRAESVDALVLPPLVGRLFPNEKAEYHVEPAVPEPTGEPVSIESIRREMAQRLEREPEVDRAMEAPFEHWRIVIRATEVPGVSSGVWTIVIVIVLVGTVVAGVTLMGRALVQQVRLSRLQTDFVSHVSHELRTPLTSIRMFIETLQSGRVQDPERVKECLDIIGVESDRLTRKIERVLGWARLEAGRRIYEMRPERPHTLVDRTLEAFRTQQLDGATTVEVDVPHDLPRVRADAEAIEEVLLNLLSNARKYGGPHVTVAGRADRKWVYLSVSDDGAGIPPAERKRIFEKFYRPDLLQTRRVEGSGLGLAIVKAIVGAHKGRVDVDSEEQRGTTFTVRLRRTA